MTEWSRNTIDEVEETIANLKGLNVVYDRRHGGPWDRGSADAYYLRPYNPHYFVGGSYLSELVEKRDMTEEEIAAYSAGFTEQTDSGIFKD